VAHQRSRSDRVCFVDHRSIVQYGVEVGDWTTAVRRGPSGELGPGGILVVGAAEFVVEFRRRGD
jgi:hypothetical protein